MAGEREQVMPADVSDYLAAVTHVSDQLAALPTVESATYFEVIARATATPAMANVLRTAGVDPTDLTRRAVAAATGFQARAAAMATSPVHEVEIMLRQQVDLAWWADAADFADAEALAGSADVVDMREWRRDGRLNFRFALASDNLVPRAWKYAIRRWLPNYAPGTPGLATPYARPQMIAVLNGIGADFAANAASSSDTDRVPQLWVNSITRTVADQQQLVALGFSAHYPSAHCRGWAADVEVGWYARFGLDQPLVEVLQQWLSEGRINAIDEGRIWHICPNPTFVKES